MVEIRYSCPHCRVELPSPEFHCKTCNESFPHVRLSETTIVDFIQVTGASGNCRCPSFLNYDPCSIDLHKLKAPSPDQKPFHKKSDILKPFLSLREKIVVDLGCREAPIGHALTEFNSVVGVDMCPQGMLGEDRNALDKRYSALLLSHAEKVPLADNSVDLVLATDLLEHVVEPEAILREAYRILKPGGNILVSVPNIVSYNNRISVLLGYGAGIELHQMLKLKSPFIPYNGPRYPDQRIHLRWFTPKSLKQSMESCDFQIETLIGYDPLLSRIPFCSKILRSLCMLAVAVGKKPAN